MQKVCRTNRFYVQKKQTRENQYTPPSKPTQKMTYKGPSTSVWLAHVDLSLSSSPWLFVISKGNSIRSLQRQMKIGTMLWTVLSTSLILPILPSLACLACRMSTQGDLPTSSHSIHTFSSWHNCHIASSKFKCLRFKSFFWYCVWKRWNYTGNLL